MLHRQFGSQCHDHSPVAGYPELPKFYSDRVGIPNAAPPALPYTYRKGIETHDMQPDQEGVQTELQELPIDRFAPEIIRSVLENQVTILVSPTGTGKSTRFAPMLINAGIPQISKVLETQPRRLAAEGVYDRIKHERTLLKGAEEAENFVAFRTAGKDDRKGSEDAPIVIYTDGYYLAKDINDNGAKTGQVLVIDEAHEWNEAQEFISGWGMQRLKEDPDARMVWMSADVELEPLIDLVTKELGVEPNIIKLTNKMYNVETREEPQSTAARETLIQAIRLHREQEESGEPLDLNGILVFMPGVNEIEDLIDEVRSNLPKEVAEETTILPLHAGLSIEERQAALKNYKGVKIVVATNIAETSITIDDIGVVIDSGYHRLKVLDEGGVQGLVLREISQASCLQRKGRVGRVGEGLYILTCLNNKPNRPFTSYRDRPKYSVAEILRTDIVRSTLRFAAVGYDIENLPMVHSVSSESCRRAKKVLRNLGAMALDAEVTPLGYRMNEYSSLRAQLALMVVESERYSPQTQAYVAAVAGSIEAGGLRYYSRDGGTAWKDLTDEKSSDPLAQLDIFIAMQDASDKDLVDYDLSVRNFKLARESYERIMRRRNFKFEKLVTPTADERDDIKRCIMTGFKDSIYVYKGNNTYGHLGDDRRLRELSRRSVTGKVRFEAVVGDPYRVEKYDGTTVDILENPTSITMADIGRIATDSGMVTWKSEGIKPRNDVFVEVQRQQFHGIKLGATKEVVAEPSLKLREAIIAHVLEHPLPQQRYLRDLKKELEQLKHLAKDPVQVLSHDTIIALVKRATPYDITDPKLVDNNLRKIIADENITLEQFVSIERQIRIVADAPSTIKVGDNDVVSLMLDYRNGVPIARHFRESDIFELHDEVFLPDGRQVCFSNAEGKRCTLLELKSKMFETIAQY